MKKPSSFIIASILGCSLWSGALTGRCLNYYQCELAQLNKPSIHTLVAVGAGVSANILGAFMSATLVFGAVEALVVYDYYRLEIRKKSYQKIIDLLLESEPPRKNSDIEPLAEDITFLGKHFELMERNVYNLLNPINRYSSSSKNMPASPTYKPAELANIIYQADLNNEFCKSRVEQPHRKFKLMEGLMSWEQIKITSARKISR
jgi:hypothetical protein